MINIDSEKFLQERYYLFLSRNSAELELQPCENEDDDTVTIKFVKIVSFDELKDYVSWIKDSDAWTEMLNLLPPKKLNNDYI